MPNTEVQTEELPTLNVFNQRYYSDPPESKTLEACQGHGWDHKGYGWSKQIDPRWNAAQRKAYEDAYNGVTP